jgi:guanine deaminase
VRACVVRAWCGLAADAHRTVPCSTLDAPRALRAGCQIGLCTDVGGGYHHSILNACRTAVIASRCLFAATPIDWKYTLWLATRGGAAALGMALGGFEVGNEFDAQLVDVSKGDVILNTPGALAAAKAALCTTTARAESAAAAGASAQTRAVEVLVEKYVNLGDDRNVKAVWVRGRCVHGSVGGGGGGSGGGTGGSGSCSLL